MNAAAASLAPARPAAPDRPVRLWIPLVPVLILLSPLLLMLVLMGAVYLWIRGVNPLSTVAVLIRLFVSLAGTRVEINTASAVITIF
jgi:hypothetical protein